MWRWILVFWIGVPGGALAQAVCQPLQGTAAHAACLNQQLARPVDPVLQALEAQGQGLTAPDLLLSRRDRAPLPPYSPDFAAGQAAERRLLELSTQARSQALADRVTRSLALPAYIAPVQ